MKMSHLKKYNDFIKTRIGFFSLITRPRTTEEKKNFYFLLVKELGDKLGIQSEDVMINLTVNTDEDWSFGFGRAQFLTGEL